MAPEPENNRSSSTTFGWRHVKIRASAGTAHQRGGAAPFWRKMARLGQNEEVTLRIRYRGGAEAWYEVHARGSFGRYPGDRCIHDIIRDVRNDF